MGGEGTSGRRCRPDERRVGGQRRISASGPGGGVGSSRLDDRVRRCTGNRRGGVRADRRRIVRGGSSEPVVVAAEGGSVGLMNGKTT